MRSKRIRDKKKRNQHIQKTKRKEKMNVFRFFL
jgi:hypothetical protein